MLMPSLIKLRFSRINHHCPALPALAPGLLFTSTEWTADLSLFPGQTLVLSSIATTTISAILPEIMTADKVASMAE